MRSAGVRGTVLARATVAAVCWWLYTSCGGGAGATDPEDPDGSGASFAELFGPTLVRADESTVGIQAVQGKALVGIYFAARWCPACASFTPRLVSAYDALRKADKSFEIVMSSFDYSSADMFAHMRNRGMAWLAIPYESAKRRALSDLYGVTLIPTLVVLDSDGMTITRDGQDDIVLKGAAAYEDWLAASRGR